GLTSLSGNVFFAPTLVPSTPIAGDFNNDGIVDAADLAVWKTQFAAGQMTGNDFLAWQRNYGASSTTLAAAVPEPASVALCVAAGASLGTARRLGRARRPRHLAR